MDIGKYVSENLMAFIPVYLTDKGNCTLLYTYEGGENYVDRTLRSVLRLLSKHFLVDLKELKEYYGKLLNIRNTVPIAFDEHNIFIPIKTRKPLCKNDGAIGYINIDYIEKIEDKGSNTIIHLINGHEIKCYVYPRTVNKHVKNGRIVKELIGNKDEFESTMRERNLFYEEFDEPATKGDIAVLMKEILKLIERLDKLL